jgi:hypothetical protein
MVKCPRLTMGFRKGDIMLRLSAPTHMIFYISVALVVISVVLHVMAYMGISTVPTTGYLILLVGYLVLLGGVTFSGA